MLKSVPVWRRLATVLCIVGVLAPAAVHAAENPQDELEDVQRELDDARSGLDGVEERKAVELEDLEQLDARRAELDQELAALNERLSAAQAKSDESASALEATTSELVATEAELGATRAKLTRQRDAFTRRARSTYMYGGRQEWIGVFVDIDGVEELERGMQYARSILDNDRERVERISALESVIGRMTADLAVLQERRAGQAADDAQRRDAAAAIVAEREEVARAVDAEAEKRRVLVARLETDRRSYVAMVQNLEAESRNLQEELARIAAEERAARLAAEAAAREAAEARAVAAAARDAAAAVPPPPPAPDPPAAPPADATGFVWPASGPVTSPFGPRTHPIFGTSGQHDGIDIGAGYGSPVVAATSGTVVSAGNQGGYGNAVAISHDNGLATFYAHQASLVVSAGEAVSRGQVIGYVGSTGYSTGPHLHFEVRVNGAPVDPMSYL